MNCKLMIGAICYLPDTVPHLEERIHNQLQQQEWLEESPLVSGCDFEYCRVRVGWSEKTKAALSTDLDEFMIVKDPPSSPGASRNELLKRLYESDFDYLVCMDDDHILSPSADSFDFLAALTSSLAEAGALFLFTPDIYLDKARKERIQAQRKSAIGMQYHLFERARITGNLQICCIPNLVKYGKEPVFFDEESYAQENEIPEDAKFLTDYVVAGYPIYRCSLLASIALDNYSSSSLYASKAVRREGSPSRIKILNEYVEKVTRGRIKSYMDLYKINTAQAKGVLPRIAK